MEYGGRRQSKVDIVHKLVRGRDSLALSTRKLLRGDPTSNCKAILWQGSFARSPALLSDAPLKITGLLAKDQPVPSRNAAVERIRHK